MVANLLIVLSIQIFFTLNCNASTFDDKHSSNLSVTSNRPLRGVGVNYFNAFSRAINRPDGDRSYRQGLKILSKHEIPFARVMIGGYWPNEMELYRSNRSRYFEILDDFVRTAEEQNVGIIANLCWNYPTIPDLVGEPVSAWGLKNSKTNSFYRQYVSDVVSRYRNSSAIWMWEFSNEMSLYVDLPNAAEWRSPTSPKQGTPKVRTKLDELTSDDMLIAMEEFRDAVRRYDFNTPLSSGNSLPRPYAFHNTLDRSWKHDTDDQFCQVLARDNPNGFDVISLHVYPTTKTRKGMAEQDYDALFRLVRKCSKQLGKQVFVGEFGVGEKDGFGRQDGVKGSFQKLSSALVENEIYLSALWVYDFSHQEGSYNVTEKNARAYQLEEVRTINRKIKSLFR